VPSARSDGAVEFVAVPTSPVSTVMPVPVPGPVSVISSPVMLCWSRPTPAAPL